MKQKDSQRGLALVDVIKSDSIVSLSKEYAEIGIDSVLDSGALRRR